MKPMDHRGRALLQAYKATSDLDDQPAPEVWERIEASTAAEQPRAAARWGWWVVAGAAAAAVLGVFAWPSGSASVLDTDTPVSSAVDAARDTTPREESVPTAMPQESVDATPQPKAVEHDAVPVPETKPPAKRDGRVGSGRELEIKPPAPDDGLQRELAVLRRAKTAMRAGTLETASKHLAEHSRSFPNGQLAEDRDALWVAVRCRKGARNSGRAAFEAAHPSSHHLPAIRAACQKKSGVP